MPRRPSNQRKIGYNSEDSIKNGVVLIRNGMSMRQASKTVGVPFATLKRYYWKTKNTPSLEGLRLQPNYSVNKMFTTEQEHILKDYINHCALLFYGLTSKECRQLAYQCVIINNLKMPPSWEKMKWQAKTG
ncbi:CENP-B N-terminal DNA-binding domain [Popillia japonica]|uniref:CENP-B N-terminal DNA-binding domain n=1 Tax=Popillia japonica TaxID=7064 RepID=A0AAW1IWM9_POPJA